MTAPPTAAAAAAGTGMARSAHITGRQTGGG